MMTSSSENQEPGRRSATLARGAGVTFVGHLVGRGLGFVLTLVLTRWLGAADFGLIVLALSIVQVASLFADIGLRDGALRFVALAEGREDPTERSRVMVTVLRWSATTSVAAALVLALAGPLLARQFRQPALGWMIPVLAVGLPFSAVGLVLKSMLQALKQLPAIALLHNMADPVTRILIFLGCAALGWGVAAAVASYVTAALVVFAGALAWLRPWWPCTFHRLPPNAARAIMAFSLPLSLAHLAGLVMQTADSLVLGYFSTAHALGVYGAAGRVAALGGMTLLAGSMAFAPHANELFGRGDRAGIQRLYAQVTRWLIILGLPLYVLTVVFAAPVLGIFGAEFREGAPLLIVLATGILISVATGPAGDVVITAGRSKLVLLFSVLVATLNVGLQWALVPRWGVLGAALATASTVAASNTLNVVLAWWFVGVQPYEAALIKPLILAAGTMTATALAVSAFGAESFMGAGLVLLLWTVAYPAGLLCFARDAADATLVRALLGRRGCPSGEVG